MRGCCVKLSYEYFPKYGDHLASGNAHVKGSLQRYLNIF